MPTWIIQLIIAVVLYAVAYFLTPRQKKTPGDPPGNAEATTVDEGTEIPVFFGPVWTGEATLVWWGDTEIETRQYTLNSGSGKK